MISKTVLTLSHRNASVEHGFNMGLESVIAQHLVIDNMITTLMMMMMMMMMMSCFRGMVHQRTAFMPYFQREPLSEILTIANSGTS